MLGASGQALLAGLDNAAIEQVRAGFGEKFGYGERTPTVRYIVGVASRAGTTPVPISVVASNSVTPSAPSRSR